MHLVCCVNQIRRRSCQFPETSLRKKQDLSCRAYDDDDDDDDDDDVCCVTEQKTGSSQLLYFY